MGYSIVPHKGEPTMCEQPCNHRDCALWREFFNSKCEICEKPFEEGQRYYQTEPGRKLKDERRWVHATCAEEAGEVERVIKERNELKQRLDGVDRAMTRIEKWYNRLIAKDDIVKHTLETVFRIFDDEVKAGK